MLFFNMTPFDIIYLWKFRGKSIKLICSYYFLIMKIGGESVNQWPVLSFSLCMYILLVSLKITTKRQNKNPQLSVNFLSFHNFFLTARNACYKQNFAFLTLRQEYFNSLKKSVLTTCNSTISQMTMTTRNKKRNMYSIKFRE